jgi:hypothetical protein
MSVMTDLTMLELARNRRGNRFDHMLRRFSDEMPLIEALRRVGVDRSGARRLLDELAVGVGVPATDVSFHRGRSPHTGYCTPPRRVAAIQTDEAWLAAWEADRGRRWPENGLIRLGDPTALATIAHEFAHHMIHYLDRPATPAHGKRWVVRYDVSARTISSLIGQTLADA